MGTEYRSPCCQPSMSFWTWVKKIQSLWLGFQFIPWNTVEGAVLLSDWWWTPGIIFNEMQEHTKILYCLPNILWQNGGLRKHCLDKSWSFYSVCVCVCRMHFRSEIKRVWSSVPESLNTQKSCTACQIPCDKGLGWESTVWTKADLFTVCVCVCRMHFRSEMRM